MLDPDVTTNVEGYEQELALVVSQLADRFGKGEKLDLSTVCAQYPAYAKDLRELWGVIVVANMAAVETSQATLPRVVPNTQGFELPREFGGYTLEKEIGRGGMGIVFRARRHSDGQIVAIKMILRGEFASEVERCRFEAEATAVARLNHPHIIPIYEIGSFEGNDFFCMKLLEGESLAERLARNPLAADKSVAIMLQITDAIVHAHEKGILHRDLKPSNILFDRDGNAFVADFGLAKSFNNKNSLTRSGAVLGTPSYMAPEQASGTRAQVGPASDVYSLGAILYHTLTGRPPFVGVTAVDTVIMVIEQDPIAPRVLNPNCDRSLEMIAMRCLQKPIDLRYDSAMSLKADLLAFSRKELVSARLGRFSQIVGNLLRDTHHAVVLENWGLLWIWHSLVLLVTSLLTELFFWNNVQSRFQYWMMWTVGIGAWAAVFWVIRRRMGPVTFVERQVAHVWGASMMGVMLLFPLEYLLNLPVLKLSPILALLAGSVFLIKGGMLAGYFYFPALIMFASSFAMARWPEYAMIIFGITSAVCFFVSGLKYYRRKKMRLAKGL